MAISEQELWACAHELIRQHGEDAAIFAALRADALFDEGELDGAATFRRIVTRIIQLQAPATIQ